MPSIQQIGIFSKPNAQASYEIVPRLLDWLSERNLRCRIDEMTAQYAGKADGLPREQVPEGCQLIIVLGGDGTLLSAARATGSREIPLFAVNLGSLGFLTAITTDSLFLELERVLAGQSKVSKRRMLHVELLRGDTVRCTYEALNDIVVTKASIARMIEVEAYVNSHFMCSYRADGLILASPTGSTAYSLAAGGPIVFPTVEAICITPICPHTLTNRPVIVPSDVFISIVNRATDDAAFLTVDGQVGEPLHEGDRINSSRSDHFIHLVRPPQNSFFDVLRQKLKWGEG
jgi:NAD+ kinase